MGQKKWQGNIVNRFRKLKETFVHEIKWALILWLGQSEQWMNEMERKKGSENGNTFAQCNYNVIAVKKKTYTYSFFF